MACHLRLARTAVSMHTKSHYSDNWRVEGRRDAHHSQHRNSERPEPKGGDGQVVLVGLGVMAFFYFASSVVLPVLIAIVAALALKPVIQCLTRLHIPRILAAFLVMGFFMTAIGFGFARLKDPVLQWANRAPEYKERFEQRVDRLLGRAAPSKQPPQQQPQQSQKPNPAEAAKLAEASANTHSSPVQFQDYQGILAWTGATLGETVEAAVLIFLLLISDDWFLRKLMQASRSRHGQTWVRETLDEIQGNISRYLFSVSVINICLGVVVGAGLAVLKFPNAAMWGAMAFLLNFVPYFGPIVGIIVLGVVGLFTMDSFPKELYPMIWYLIVHVSEADFITPIFLGKRFTIHPIIIFVFLMFSSWIWGISGALIAVPVLVSIKVICDRVPALTKIANLLSK